MEKRSSLASEAARRTSPFRYGIGMFGTSIPINMFKSFAAIFYVDMLGLSMEKYSLVLLIYTFVDAIDNPVYGFLSDRTRTKWGRRRPWLVIGVPLLILCFIMFFNVPSFISSDSGMLFVYMLLMYILTGTLDSLMNANYGALFPELFREDTERAKTNAIRQAFQLVAMVISIALTPMITKAIGYGKTSVIYGIAALIVIMYCTFGCKENPESWSTKKPKIFSSIWALLKSKKFWIFGFTGAFYSAAFSLISQAVPFYVKYTLHLESDKTTIMLAAVFAVALIGILIWTQIIKRVYIVNAWRISFVVMAVGIIPMYFASNLITAVCIAGVVGLGVAGCLTTMDCIGAKIMDDDYKRYGVKREGIISSCLGVMNRLNGLFTSAAFFTVSKAFGFVNGDNPGNNPDVASKMLLIVFPAVAVALAAVFSMFLHFEDEKKK